MASTALRRNPWDGPELLISAKIADWRRIEIHQDSGLARIPGLSARDRREGEDAEAVDTPQTRESKAGVLRLRAEVHAELRYRRAGGSRSSLERIYGDGVYRSVSGAVPGLRGEAREGAAVAGQGAVFQAV